MEEECFYIDLRSKEGKVILTLARQYLEENWELKSAINFTDYGDGKDIDILEIYRYDGSFIMELNVFRKGKYYSMSKNIESEWITPRLREARLKDLGI